MSRMPKKYCKKIIQTLLVVLLFLLALSLSECTPAKPAKKECLFLENEIAGLKEQLAENPSEELHALLGLKMFECVKLQSENAGVIKENMPVLMHKPGNKKGVLLIHGFTATPWEIKGLGTFLAENGFSVYIPLLRGHGIAPDFLRGVSWKDWYASTAYGYELLANLVDEVNVVGLSMGGLLSIILASNYPVNSLATINTPMLVKDKRIYFANILQYFWDYTTNPNVAKEEELYYYKERLVSAIAELNYLINEAKLNLYKVNSPVLIVQTNEDPVVEPFSARIIFQGVHSKNKNLFTLENDVSHTPLKGRSKDELFREMLGFLEEH